MREYSIELPGSAIQTGRNTLQIRYSSSVSPYEINGSGDHRQLAVAWDWIRFDLEPPKVAPVSDSDFDLLTLSAGTQVDFFFLVRPGDRLTIDEIANPGAPRVRLEVSYSEDGAPELELVSADEVRPSHSIELPAQLQTPARLRFRTFVRDGRNQTAQPLQIRGARVESRLGSASPPDSQIGSSESQPRADRPNVLLYLVDTLRSDRLGAYGNPRQLTPALDALATESLVFEHAFAHSSWTKPSVASILTGLLPFEHGVNHRRHRLADSFTTIAEALGNAGYATAAFAMNPYLNEGSGLQQGFDHFDLSDDRPDEVIGRAISWLDQTRSGSPFLLYVHTVEPHDPYSPPDEFRRKFAPGVEDREIGTAEHIKLLGKRKQARTDEVVAAIRSLYDAEVAYCDRQFGNLMQELRELDLFDDTLIIFVSDHGEAFYEHGAMGHGWDLYKEVVEVPLIVRPPGGMVQKRVANPRQLVDIVPTVLTYVGLALPRELSGLSLSSSEMAGERVTGSVGGSPVFSYMDYDGRRGVSAISGRWKLIEPLSDSFLPQRVLFDRLADPSEAENLAYQHPVLAGWLASLARKQVLSLDSAEPPDKVEFDEKTERQLRALGYIE
jgi:arylsulfatase A-like enzyme